MRRVVITGLEAVTPLGLDWNSTWEAMKDSRSGIESYEKEGISLPIGRIKDFNPACAFSDPRYAKRLDRVISLGLFCAKRAMEDSGLRDLTEEQTDRFSVFIGSGIGGLGTLENQISSMNEKGIRGIGPFFIPSSIVDMCSGFVSMELGLHGSNFAIASACATSNHNIGEAWKNIRHGYSDYCLCGGADATLVDSGIWGFHRMRALSSRDCPAEEASCPFDERRDGFVLSEGSAVLLLEEYEKAKKRGAEIYGEIVGYGATADAYHISNPHPEGKFARKAMEIAIEQAGIPLEKIGYISAHGTSTPVGDLCETKAIKELFKERAKDTPVSSIKSMIGHTLGASGAIEALACLMAFKENVLPPTINLNCPDSECDLDYVSNTAREKSVDYILSNSFGFGGHNSSLLLKKI